MAVIEIEGLRKVYRSLRGGTTVALDGLDMIVPEGGVFGLLGPNGSGKTTTIRCLLGLSRPTGGRCHILGVDPTTNLHSVITRIGSIVESPALFPNFSGRRNLDLLAGMYGISRSRVESCLDVVGLTTRQSDLFRKYSLGMRQRLAIAAALLKDPELLILDEPANGLDPAGIREVRQLLRRLTDEGRTVLVSSHILSEVQQLCDDVAILAKGRRVVQGNVAEVLARGTRGQLLVKIGDPAAAVSALVAAGLRATANGQDVAVEIDPRHGASVVRTLAAKGLYPYEVRPEEVDLETVFLELTAGGSEVAA